MEEWKLHGPSQGNVFCEYKCGLVAGQKVALRKELVILNNQGEPTGEVFPKGEIWEVLPGLRSDPVLWFRQANGERHTWVDTAEELAEWFEVVDPA
jgi:hypothetical protein